MDCEPENRSRKSIRPELFVG